MKSAFITTLYSNHNYGAMLQAHALQKYLQQLNVDARILDFQKRESWPSFLMFPKKWRRAIQFYRSMLFMKEKRIRFEAFDLFLKNFIKIKENPHAPQAVSSDTCDLLICGSDQIWNPNLPFGLEFFLYFGDKDIPRISYAASFGNSDIPDEKHDELVKLLGPFSSISCRESKGCMFLENLLGRDVKHVVDPTLLLSKQYWSSISVKLDEVPSNYLLVYALDVHPAVKRHVHLIAKALNLRIVNLDVRDDPAWSDIFLTVRTAGPLEFLSLFSNADFIVTNSFHGNIFSLIFNKQFYSIPHRYSNGRMADLLKRLDIMEVQKIEHILKDPLSCIDYSIVNVELDRMRSDSYKFLDAAINIR